MLLRLASTLVMAGICLCASPAVSVSTSKPVEPDLQFDSAPLPSDPAFAEAARTDALRFLNIAAKRYKIAKPEGNKPVMTGYTATFVKQERMGGVLHPPETIRVDFREEPYSVLMDWKLGARGLADGTLYVVGERDGKLLARSKVFGKTIEVGPRDSGPRANSRYSIEDFGFYLSTRRAVRVWNAAAAIGCLEWEYVGTRAVPETGDRECHIIRRRAVVDEIDPFANGEANPKITDANRADAARTITLYFDSKTWLQVGSVLHRADGELAGSYFFRDVVLNPTWTAGAFTPKALKK